MNTPLAAKMKKNNQEMKVFADQLLNMARKELGESKMNNQDYSKMVDLITCMNLKANETLFEITSYMNSKRRKSKHHKFDVRA